MVDIVSPIDGEVAFRFDHLDINAALAALERAEDAQRAWRETPLAERIALCRRMLGP